MEKVCFKCQIIKPLSDFYKHKQMGDGHLNKCKDCTKKDVGKHREENLEKIREYDRNRPNHEERLQRNKEYAKSERGRKASAIVCSNYRAKQKLRYKAHNMINYALSSGKISRPETCSCCNIGCVPHGHHNDYTKPLEVIWLCVDCHIAFHKEVKLLERQFERQHGYKPEDNTEQILEVAEWYWKEKTLSKVS